MVGWYPFNQPIGYLMGEIKRYLKYNSIPPYNIWKDTRIHLQRPQINCKTLSSRTFSLLDLRRKNVILSFGFVIKHISFVFFCCCQCTKIITQQFRFFSKKTKNSTTLEFVIFSSLFLGHPIASFFPNKCCFH